MEFLTPCLYWFEMLTINNVFLLICSLCLYFVQCKLQPRVSAGPTEHTGSTYYLHLQDSD